MPDLESQIKAIQSDTCKFYTCAGCCGTFCLGAFIGLIILLCSINSLGPEEQIIIYGTEGKYEKNGPATILVGPGKKTERRKAVRLGPREYLELKDIKTGDIRHEAGPQTLFMKAYDENMGVNQKIVLQKGEYMRLIASLTGYERVITGPSDNPNGVVPEPLETAPNGTENAVIMGKNLAVLALNKTNGKKRLYTTGGAFIPAPYEFVLEVRTATLLGFREFALVKDLMEGTLRHEEGPKLLQVGAYEQVVHVKPRLVLEKDQYIRLLDEKTGRERVVRGPETLVPRPSEVYPEGVQKAKFLDTETAVLVLNQSSGQERLVAERGVFVPNPEEEILETRKLIRVSPQETVVVRDDKGTITVYSGNNGLQNSAFFLPAYAEVVTHDWSSYSDPPASGSVQTAGRNKFTKIDMTERTMFFLWQVRSSDNVKLSLEGTIFWRVMDVPLMINVTSDPEGDVWHHVRSSVIQAVSSTSLETFRNSYANITTEAFKRDAADGFYGNRGVTVKSMDITKWECADATTHAILQQIIQESTNRVNRLQIQKGENEVAEAKLTAEIKMETQKTEFIQTQAKNKRLEARMQGEASGMTLMRAAESFISGLNTTVDNVTSRVELYKLHETLKGHNQDTKNLASGKAELFLTPSNVNLKLAMGGAEASSVPVPAPAASGAADSGAADSGARRLEDGDLARIADGALRALKDDEATPQEL